MSNYMVSRREGYNIRMEMLADRLLALPTDMLKLIIEKLELDRAATRIQTAFRRFVTQLTMSGWAYNPFLIRRPPRSMRRYLRSLAPDFIARRDIIFNAYLTPAYDEAGLPKPLSGAIRAARRGAVGLSY